MNLDLAATGAASGFTAELARVHAALFARAVEHRFMRAAARGAVPDGVFRAYLVQEHAFVVTAVAVNGFALTKAPDAAARERFARSVLDLTTVQEAYFRRQFDALGVPAAEREAPSLPPPVRAFQDFVTRTAAQGSYAELLATVLGAEWLYATWCARAEARGEARTAGERAGDPRQREWIVLHTEAAFVDHVRWLRRELDVHAAHEDPRAGPVGRAFARTLELEIAFHDAPYASESGSAL